MLRILNSENEHFEIKIDRNVLPGVVKIQDMILCSKGESDNSYLRISSMHDDEFNLDSIVRKES